MSDPLRPLTEEALHGYVDGRLDPERQAAVQRQLEGNPELAERAAAYVRQRQALRDALAPIIVEPVPATLDLGRLVEARLRARRHGLWRMAAAAVLGVGLGAGTGGAGAWWWAAARGAGIEAVVAEAASSYAAFVRDAAQPITFSASERAEVAGFLAARLHRPAPLPDLSAAGYGLLGGRLIATERGVAALLVYRGAGEERLAVFVRPTGQDGNTKLRTVDVANLDGCAWLQDGLGYTLFADEPYHRLVALSQTVRDQMAGG